jgi:serine/threonine-protein kinase RsbW
MRGVMSRTIELSLDVDVAEIPRAAEAVDAFCAENGLDPKIAFDVNLAIDELATNTISYGFDGLAAAKGRIRIVLKVDESGVELHLADNGAPYDPFTQAPPPVMDGDVEDRPIGGFGVHFVKCLMDEISYRRDGDWNHIVLRRRAAPKQ